HGKRLSRIRRVGREGEASSGAVGGRPDPESASPPEGGQDPSRDPPGPQAGHPGAPGPGAAGAGGGPAGRGRAPGRRGVPQAPAPRTNVAFMPARVLMQDFTGVPAVVDLAAMRSAMARAGGDPERVNPLVDVDLIIDHSVQVDLFRSPQAYQANIDWEYRRNGERYALLRWAQQAFDGVRVVPPGAGICHQVNLEHLGKVVTTKDGE